MKFQKKINKFDLNLEDEHGLYGIGYCSNTNRIFYFDMDDYDKIKEYCWCEHKMSDGYCALETVDSKYKNTIRMHYLIIGKYADHADRNPFNNRKFNLRNATKSENSINRGVKSTNSSGFTGVYFKTSINKWVAYLYYNKKQLHLGTFINKHDAVKARLAAEKKYYGEFAPQRHLFEEYEIL
jgi:hypothetical protein